MNLSLHESTETKFTVELWQASSIMEQTGVFFKRLSQSCFWWFQNIYWKTSLSCLLAFNKHATWGSVTEYHLRKRSVTEFNSSSLFTCKFSQSSNWGVVVHCRCNCFLFQNTNLHTFPLGVYDAVYGILKTMFLNFKKQSDSILFSQKSWKRVKLFSRYKFLELSILAQGVLIKDTAAKQPSTAGNFPERFGRR